MTEWCEFQGQTPGTSALISLAALALEEASCHVVRTLQQPNGEAQPSTNLLAMQVNHLGTGSSSPR